MQKALKKPQFSIPWVSCSAQSPAYCLLNSAAKPRESSYTARDLADRFLQSQKKVVTSSCNFRQVCVAIWLHVAYFTPQLARQDVFSLYMILKCYPSTPCYFRRTGYQFVFINISFCELLNDTMNYVNIWREGSHSWRMLAKMGNFSVLSLRRAIFKSTLNGFQNSVWNTLIKSE